MVSGESYCVELVLLIRKGKVLFIWVVLFVDFVRMMDIVEN